MSCTEFHRVLIIVLVLVEEKLGLDGVLMDDEAVWLDVISRHQVVALSLICVLVFLFIESAMADELIMMVTSEHSAEAVAVVLASASVSILISEDVFGGVVAVRDVFAVLGVVIVTVSVI